MKFIKNLTTAILVAALLVVSVCAAGVAPSVELKPAPSIVYTSSNGAYAAATIRGANGKVVAVPANAFTVAAPSASSVSTAQGLSLSGVSGFSAAWEDVTGGAPASNAVVTDVFEVSVSGDAAAALTGGAEITFSVKVSGLSLGDDFVVLYNNGGWKVADAVLTSGGDLKITATAGGTFIVVGDNGALPPQLPTKSPATGVALLSSVAMLGIALCGTTAIAAGKKLSKREDA